MKTPAGTGDIPPLSEKSIYPKNWAKQDYLSSRFHAVFQPGNSQTCRISKSF